MAIIVKRKGNEPPERILVRFNKLVQSSRILQARRTHKSHQRNASKLKQKTAAIIREGHRVENKRKQFYI